MGLNALLTPFAETSAINMSERRRSAGCSQLNRHAVMHGKSVDYGTPLNGAKSIALLWFVVSVLELATTPKELKRASEPPR